MWDKLSGNQKRFWDIVGILEILWKVMYGKHKQDKTIYTNAVNKKKNKEAKRHKHGGERKRAIYATVRI